MALSLQRQAKAAEDDASVLQVFLDEIPVQDTDIASNIQCLLDIAIALRSLDDELHVEFARSGGIPTRLRDDVDLVQRNIEQTHIRLDRDLFQQTRMTMSNGRVPYRMLWGELAEQFRREGSPLYPRLELYSTFLQYIIDGLLRRPSNSERVQNLRVRLSRLLTQQSGLVANIGRLQIQEPGLWDLPPLVTPRPPSGPGFRPPSRPGFRPPSRPGLPHLQTFPPNATPNLSFPRFEVPPPAPEVNLSPTFTAASEQTWSSSWSSNSPNNDDSQAHWAMRIFDRPSPMTYSLDTMSPTRCYGREEPHARELLRRDAFSEVMNVPVQENDYKCRFFWRQLDGRARILVTRRDSQGRAVHYCCPTTILKLVRRTTRLYLNRYDSSGSRYMPWVILSFPAYEQQVLFFCTFVALKKQDSPNFPRRLDDFFPGEVVEFTGEIEDDNFLHKLILYRDTDTDAVRLEASPRRGQMISTPIWTAFITEYIGSRRWIRQVSSTIIELESLRPFVFCQQYTPPRVDGRFRLSFTTREDAQEFRYQFQRL